jgi:signal transduction histidine kinase
MRILVLIVDVMAFILCCAGIVLINAKAGLPVVIAARNDTVYCSRVSDEVFNRQMREGEAILGVNGHALTNVEDLEFILDGCRVGDTATIQIGGPSGTRVERAPLIHYYDPFYLFSVILISTLFFGVGLVVTWKKPEDPAALVYHFGSVATAVQLSTTWGCYITTPAFLGVVIRVVFSSTYAFIPVTFFHLTRLFPRPRGKPATGLLPLLYGIAAILALGAGASFVQAWRGDSVPQFHNHLQWFTATRLFLVVLVFGGLGAVRKSYIHAGDETERKKLRWVLWGMFVGFLPFVVLWVIPSMILTYGLVPESVMLLASGFIPIAFGVSIIKYHIMDIDLLFNRSMVYGTVMAVVVLVYVSIVGGLAAVVTQATYEVSLGVSAGAAIVIALLFEPTRRVVQQMVDRRFFRVRYDFRRAARRFQEDVKTCVTIDDLGNLMAERIDTLVPLERIGFLLVGDDGTGRLLGGRGLVMPDPDLLTSLCAQAAIAGRSPLAVSEEIEPGVVHRHADKGVLAKGKLALICPVVRADTRLLGMLLFGPKKAGTRFTSEDLDLFGNLAVQGGAEMERVLLQHAIMEKIAEADRLQRLNSLKSDFVSYVSHELRTPLTSIRMFAELLAKRLPRADRSAREYVHIIEGESDRLQRMVNTFLDSAKIDQGQEHYAMRSVRLDVLLRSVVKTMKYQLAKEEFIVDCVVRADRRVAPGRAFSMHADPDAFKEAVLNLLTNAMKYSGTSKNIRITLIRSGRVIRCGVEDFGRGMSPEVISRLFEKFYRDPSLPRRVQGVGLGLSVVKHIMDAHGGTIEVRSAPGNGSTFTLVFPVTTTAGRQTS